MHLYDTLSRQIKKLEPRKGGLRVYVCGVTVYDRAHLGHGRSSIVFDVLLRHLKHSGFNPKFVRNFTDVDDRIIQRANAEGVEFQTLAERYIKTFNDDMRALNTLPPDVVPRASAEIGAIIELIAKLVEGGAAYTGGGNVYFRVATNPDYGKLSRRLLENMLAGAKGKSEVWKKAPADFALWKARKPDEPYWPSPWGEGRPGWHIECSAMVWRYLGEQIDIHGGGNDLIFPHHENELAQSESALRTMPMAKFWMHNGMVILPKGEKMSKSLGNSAYVGDELKRHSADAIRLWALQAHYRAPLNLDQTSIDDTEKAVTRLREMLNTESSGSSGTVDPAPLESAFDEALNDDLDTPRAVATLFELRKLIAHGIRQGVSVRDAQKSLRNLCSRLGFTLSVINTPSEQSLGDETVERLVKLRDEARKAGDFKRADEIRQTLAKANIGLRDSAHGVEWSRGG